MANKERKINFVQESKTEVLKIIKRWKDKQTGQEKAHARWETVTDGEINLGSLKNPNRDIIKVKFHNPDKQRKDFFQFFRE